MSYSQNGEDLFVQQYFGNDFKGTLLEIGANDGITLSNSRLLIELGWRAYLLEPGSVFAELSLLYAKTPRVECLHYGIGERDEVVTFYESGPHVQSGSDTGLVSTCNYYETIRWRNMGVDFKETQTQLVKWSTFTGNRNKFDFISIDAEGMDWQILRQIDLVAIGCKAICIEWNGNHELFKLFVDYCYNFKLKLAVKNAENLIFVK